MKTLSTIAIAVLLGVPALSYGEAPNVVLKLTTEMEYNDNVFYRPKDEKDDWIANIQPELTFRGDAGNSTYNLLLRTRYGAYDEYSELDRWNHTGAADIVTHFSDVTTMTLYDRFHYGDRGQANLDDTGNVVEIDADKRTENDLRMKLSHAFSPRWRGLLGASYAFTDLDGNNFRDYSSGSVNTGFDYAASERSRVGMQARFSRQDFDSSDRLASASTDYYNLSGTYSYEAGQTFTLKLEAGPALAKSDLANQRSFTMRQFPIKESYNGQVNPYLFDGSCGTSSSGTTVHGCGTAGLDVYDFPGFNDLVTVVYDPALNLKDPDDDNVTIFGAVEVVKRWKNGYVELRYDRKETSAGGSTFTQGTSTIQDGLYLNWMQGWTKRLKTMVRTSLHQYKSANDQRVPNAVVVDSGLPNGFATLDPANIAVPRTSSSFQDTVNLNVSARLYYRFTSRLNGVVTLTYFDRSEDGNLNFGVDRDLDRITALVGVEYTFDPYFW